MNEMARILIIRGWPGCGKTHIAKLLKNEFGDNVKVFENNDYFMRDGKYVFNKNEMNAAILDCQDRVEEHVNGGGTAIVTNCFTKISHMDWFFDLAKRLNVTIDVINVVGNRQSPHFLPPERLLQMKTNFERGGFETIENYK